MTDEIAHAVSGQEEVPEETGHHEEDGQTERMEEYHEPVENKTARHVHRGPPGRGMYRMRNPGMEQYAQRHRKGAQRIEGGNASIRRPIHRPNPSQADRYVHGLLTSLSGQDGRPERGAGPARRPCAGPTSRAMKAW